MFLKALPTTVLWNPCCLKTLLLMLLLWATAHWEIRCNLCLPVSEPLGRIRIVLTELMGPKLKKYEKKITIFSRKK